LGKTILYGLFVCSLLSLSGCDTHKPQAPLPPPQPVITAPVTSPSFSPSEVAELVMARIQEKWKSEHSSEQGLKTLHDKGRDVASLVSTVRELFPAMTEEEAQYYALEMMHLVGLPTPKIAALGAEKKAGVETSGDPRKTESLGSPSKVSSGSGDPLLASSYEVFPQEDQGADLSVPAELGGKGFSALAQGMGFETSLNFGLIGDPRALKGGSFSFQVQDYPETLRPCGKRSNTWFNYLSRDLMYDRLLYYHHTELTWCPMLATHWKVEQSESKQVFWYRLNPNARWADGTPVTTEDVLETWRLLVDPDLESPSDNETYSKFHEPVVLSKYLLKVEAKKLNWRNFNYFSGFHILQAKELKQQSTKEWLEKYNFRYMTASGPYTANAEDLESKKGSEVSLTRRPDYWAINHRRAIGCFNFDVLRYLVIREDRPAFEAVKAGDYDCYLMGTAKWWVEDTEGDKFKRGLLLKRRFYSAAPSGVQGLALQMNRYPLNDVRVRKAIALLVDRRELLEKLMYNQYEPQVSYWSYGDYSNPNNPKNDYDPDTALKLLAEAGWDERNEKGRLVRDGVPLELELIYSSPGFKQHLSLVQNTFSKAGINLDLKQIAPETLWKNVQEKDYQMALMAWGALHIPNPETSWKSDLAEKPNTNNITVFKNKKVDELIEEYDKLELSYEERVRLIQEMDLIIANEYPYILLWDAPFKRFIFWNKFGYPRGGMTRTMDDSDTVSWLWWYDPEKAKRLDEALKNESISLERGETDDKYWTEVWPKVHKTEKGK
jgi:microcin C transport system substrate-binding protein